MRNPYVSFFFALSYVMLCLNIYPVFAKAPTTAKVAFGSARDGNREIYIMNPDGTQQTNLTRHKADDVSPAWSPTGEHILFASDRDRFLGSWDLYLMDPNGQNVRPVFGKSADRFSPSWSPNGKQIAYAKREHGQYLVYIADIDGKKRRASRYRRYPGLVSRWHRNRLCHQSRAGTLGNKYPQHAHPKTKSFLSI